MMLLQTLITLSLASLISACCGCCTPPQWEGTQLIAGRYSKIFTRGRILEKYSLSYDANNTLYAVAGSVLFDKSSKYFKLIFNYQQNIGYYIVPGTKSCNKFKLTRSFKPFCIPDDAEMLGTSYYGAGANTLNVTDYMKTYNKSVLSKTSSNVVVTSEGCIPVTEDISGRRGFTNFFTNVNYYGITPGIADPDVFTPPEYCVLSMEITHDDFFEEHSMLQVSHPGLTKYLYRQEEEEEVYREQKLVEKLRLDENLKFNKL